MPAVTSSLEPTPADSSGLATEHAPVSPTPDAAELRDTIYAGLHVELATTDEVAVDVVAHLRVHHAPLFSQPLALGTQIDLADEGGTHEQYGGA